MDRWAHAWSSSYADFLTLPSNVPAGAPGSPGFSGDRTNYTAEGALGGVFSSSSRPSDAVSGSSITNLDNAFSDGAYNRSFYCFNSSVTGTKVMNIYRRDPFYPNTIGVTHHLRNAGEGWGLTGWDTSNLNGTYKFYLMHAYQDPPNSGIWWWNDTR